MENKSSLNIDRIPKELKLILEFIKVEDIENFIPFLNDIDWNLFVDLAIHHRVYPLLISKLKKVEVGRIPSHVIYTLEQAFKINTFYMLKLSGEMESICKLLNKNDIPVLALKGPVLGADLFGDISLRASGDLDVIIPIDALEKVDEILLKQGYKKDDYIKTILNDWKWRHHHVTYFHSKKGIKLEVHWRLNPGPGKEPSFNKLWERKRKSSLTSYPVYYLGREDLFLFLVFHGARHGWSRIRWIIDIHQIVKQEIDWTFLRVLLKKYQVLHIGGQAIVLASELLNTAITKEMGLLIKGTVANKLAQKTVFYFEEMINLHDDPIPDYVSEYHKRYLFLVMSKKQRLLFIISFFFPYPEDAETLPLPKSLHFLYFPLRPFLWAWRRTRNHVLS